MVAIGLDLMPPVPGVYVMRDAAGRAIYIGRSGNLRARVRSYWGPLRGRRRLARLRERVAWIEPVVLASEHEAAFLERHLLHLRRPLFNRSLGGQESWVWLRLATEPARPGLTVVHQHEVEVHVTPGGDGLFGPYLGGGDARLAAAALLRLFPLRHAMADPDSSTRELARARGVDPSQLPELLLGVRAVLDREPLAVAAALTALADLRDTAADQERFEDAVLRDRQLRALEWILQVQGVAAAGGADLAASAIGRSGRAMVRVTFDIRGGTFADRRAALVDAGTEDPAPASHPHWAALARANADLLARFVEAGAVGEGLGRLAPGRRSPFPSPR